MEIITNVCYNIMNIYFLRVLTCKKNTYTKTIISEEGIFKCPIIL